MMDRSAIPQEFELKTWNKFNPLMVQVLGGTPPNSELTEDWPAVGAASVRKVK